MKTSNKLLLSLLVVALIAITAFVGVAKHYHRKGVSSTIKGDANRSTEPRTVTSYTGIKIKGRIDIHLTQGQEGKVEVNAAKNILPMITTEVKEGILLIETTSRLDEEEKVDVFITVPTIQLMDLSEGANIETTNTFSGEKLTINSNSGSNGQLSLKYKTVDCQLETGSEFDLDGSAEEAILTTTTGAHIEAGDLITQKCKVVASTGAHATVHVSQELTADINTGSVLNYRGEPAKTYVNSSSGGSANKR